VSVSVHVPLQETCPVGHPPASLASCTPPESLAVSAPLPESFAPLLLASFPPLLLPSPAPVSALDASGPPPEPELSAPLPLPSTTLASFPPLLLPSVPLSAPLELPAWTSALASSLPPSASPELDAPHATKAAQPRTSARRSVRIMMNHWQTKRGTGAPAFPIVSFRPGHSSNAQGLGVNRERVFLNSSSLFFVEKETL
jgi:hypothetical protein